MRSAGRFSKLIVSLGIAISFSACFSHTAEKKSNLEISPAVLQKIKKKNNSVLASIAGRYSGFCVTESGGYYSEPVAEKIALEIKEDGTYCFTILDKKKNGIRSRGNIVLNRTVSPAIYSMHVKDTYRNLIAEKAYECILTPEGLALQRDWNPSEGIFDTEIMVEMFYEYRDAIQKMFQWDIPLEVIVIEGNPNAVKIYRGMQDYLLEKDKKNIDDEASYRMAERAAQRSF